MPRNGTGTYVLPAGQPAVTGTVISSTTHNTFASDLATAMTQSICTDGQTPMAANLSMGSNKITNLANATLSTDAVNKSQTDAITTAYIAADTVVTNAFKAADLEGYRRNYLYNPDFAVAQRATTYALTTTTAYGSMDRWAAVQLSAANGIFDQSPVTGGTRNFCAKLGRTAASANTNAIRMCQVLETIDSTPLAGQTVILSFYAKAGANFSGANLGYMIRTGTGTDQSVGNFIAGTWTGSADPLSSTTAITASFVRYSASVTLASTVTQIGVQLYYTPVGVAGADDNVYIADVQLEIAPPGVTSPSAFEREGYGEKLRSCERFYQLQSVNATFGAYTASTNLTAPWSTRGVMRLASPTVTRITNDYLFASANVSSSTSTYYTSPYGGAAVRASAATGISSFSELISLNAEL